MEFFGKDIRLLPVSGDSPGRIYGPYNTSQKSKSGHPGQISFIMEVANVQSTQLYFSLLLLIPKKTKHY